MDRHSKDGVAEKRIWIGRYVGFKTTDAAGVESDVSAWVRGTATMNAGAGSHNPNNDVEVQNAATDGISCVAWSPNSNLLVAGSWDNQVRCWDVQAAAFRRV